DGRVAHLCITTRFQRRHLPLDLLGVPPVIGVEKRNPRARGRCHTGVASCSETSVLTPDVAHPVSVRCNYLSRIVLGSVVYDDDFFGRIGLSKHAVDALPEILAVVIRRNDHRDVHRVSSHALTIRANAHPRPLFAPNREPSRRSTSLCSRAPV